MHTLKLSRRIQRESGKTFRDRLKEHFRALSPIHHHSQSTGHPVSPGCFTIVERESQQVTRNTKEAVYIHVNHPPHNRNFWKVPIPTHMGQSFRGHTITAAQITQLYHSLHGPKPSKNYHTTNWGACTTSIGKCCPMQGCLPFDLHCYHNTPPHTPNTQHPTPNT